jgi:hypothetical protein
LAKECPLEVKDIIDQEFDFAKAVAKVLTHSRSIGNRD